MIKLYSYFRSSSAYRVRIALNMKSIKHEIIPVHLLKDGGQNKKPEYLKKNPMGQVPAIEQDDFFLPQSLAILLYLEEKFPNPALFSKDIRQKSKQVALCELVNSGIQPLQNLKLLGHIRSTFGANDDAINNWCRHWITEGFQAFEKELSKTVGNYSYGDTVTAVDCYLVPQVFNADRFKVDLSTFPTIRRINDNCLQLDAFKQAHPSRQVDAE